MSVVGRKSQPRSIVGARSTISFNQGALDTSERSYPRKTSERIARAILAYAESHELGPGDQLPTELQMAESYGVGRISIREALRILEVHGIVEIQKGRGRGPRLQRLKARSVASTLRLYMQIRGATYADILDARLAIDPLLSGRAAERATRAERTRLLEEARALQLISIENFEELGLAAMRFTVGLGSSAHNSCLELFAHALADIQTLRTSTFYRNTNYWVRNRKNILVVAEAVMNKDRSAAREATTEKITFEVGFARRTYPSVLGEIVCWD
jgi:DNA-binding FadR family transcriptional regulator